MKGEMDMVRNRSGRALGIVPGIGIGVCASTAVSLIGSMILAWLVSSETVGEDGFGWGCMVILTIASILGCVSAWCCVKQRRLLVTGLTMIGYMLMLLLAGSLLGGVSGGVGGTAMMIAIGGGISLIPAFLSGKGGAKKVKIPHYR